MRFVRSRQRMLAVAFLLCSSGVAFAQAPTALPTDLDLVPRDAAAFFHFRANDIWQTDWLKDARQLLDRAGPEAWKDFVKKSPIDPGTIDRITLIMVTPQTLGEPFPQVDPEAMSALVVVRTSKPFDRLALLQAIQSREKAYNRQLYYFNEDLWSSLVLVDEQTFLVGSEDAIVRWFDMRRAKNAGPLQVALAEAPKHHVTIGLNPGALGKEAQQMPPPVAKLFEAQCALATLDLAKEIRLDLRLEYEKAEQAAAGEKAVRDSLELARQGLTIPIGMIEQEMKNQPDKIESLPESFAMLMALGFLREVDVQLKNLTIQRQGATVTVPFRTQRMDSAGAAGIVMLGAIVSFGRSANMAFNMVGQAIGKEIGGPAKDPMQEYMKTLHAALEKYQADKGSYPAPAVLDKEGRPILSWRVALLPYFGDEGKALYNEFRLDEPWDSLNNKRLLKKLPKALQSPYGYYGWGLNKYMTETQMLVGKETPFVGGKGPRKADLPAKSLLLVNASNLKVYWTKPADIVYAAEKPLGELFNPPPKPGRNAVFFGGGANSIPVMLTDGTYRMMQLESQEKDFRGLIAKPKP
jgi:hypothetical protein